MRKSAVRLSLAGCSAFAALAAAQPSYAQSGPSRIEVRVYSYGYSPQTITMAHGQPYRLEFTNTARSGHDFSAKAFFSAAQVAAADEPKVEDGKVKLDGGETVDVDVLAPAPGTYEFHCSHFFHASRGMKGEIIVR